MDCHFKLRRPKSAPVITDAYFQNKREEESLSEKLDGIHYQHHAGLIRLRQAMGLVVRQRQNLLTQRAVTPQSSLENVMEEIQTLKQVKHSTGKARSYLPTCKVEAEVGDTYSKWLPAPSSLSLCSASCDSESGGIKTSSHTEEKEIPVRNCAKTKPNESAFKCLENADKPITRKPRATSSLERRADHSMESLTYRELGEIALLENISMREAQKQRQKKLLEKELLSKSFDSILQQKINNFLKKFE